MNSSKLRRRTRLLSTVLTAVLLVILAALSVKLFLAGQERQMEASVTRGTIYDRSGQPLAVTTAEGGRSYPGGAADSALVGYRSVNHGSDGIERIMGEWLAPKKGDNDHGDLTLTVDGALQQVCYESILPASVGGAVVLDIETGEILAAVDTPSFEQGDLDIDYDEVISRGCVFYNICACSSITPGDMFLLPACGAAYEAGEEELAQALVSGDLSGIDPDSGRREVQRALSRRLLGREIELDCMTLRSGFAPEDSAVSGKEYLASLSGQGSARLSPMQICMYTCALARSDGHLIRPHALYEQVSRSGEKTVYPDGEVLAERIFDANSRSLIKERMTERQLTKGSFVSLESSAVSGSTDNIWLTAYAPAEQPKYALTLVLQSEAGTLDTGDAVEAAESIFGYLLGE